MVTSSKRFLHLLTALGILLVIKLFVPATNGLTTIGVSVLAIFAAVIYLWIFVAIDWPSFLVVVIFGSIAGGFGQGASYEKSFGTNMIPLNVAVMLMNDVMQKVGINKKLATWFITRNMVRNRPYVFITMFFLAGMVLHLFMEIIPPLIMMLAMAESICDDLGYQRGEKFRKVLAMGILWTGVVMFGSSPIAHATILIVIGVVENMTGVRIPYIKYMAVGIPFALLFLTGTMLTIKFIIRPDVSKFVNYDIDKRRTELQPLSTEAKVTLAIFLCVVVMWILPEFGAFIPFLKPLSDFLRTQGAAFPPVLGVGAMAIVSIKGKPLMNFLESIKNVSWGSVLFACTILLISSNMSMESAGISKMLNNVVGPIAASVPAALIVIVSLVLTALVTQFMSNVLTAVLMINTFGTVLLAASGNVALVTVLGVLTAMVANTAFLTPSSSAAAPILFGSNNFTVIDGVKFGIVPVLYSIVVIIVLILPLARLVFGA
jgi:sodium-dependent dicarboxylate transporter 2/3/5